MKNSNQFLQRSCFDDSEVECLDNDAQLMQTNLVYIHNIV